MLDGDVRQENYEEMLFAIIDQAVMDYAKAKCSLRADEVGLHPVSTRGWIKLKCTIRGCEMYLKEINEIYGLDVDTDYLLETINRDIEECDYSWKAVKEKYNKV